MHDFENSDERRNSSLTTMAHRTPKTWRRDGFFLTTDSSLIPLTQLNDIFGQADFSWGKPLSESHFRAVLKTSIIFAIFEDSVAAPNAASTGHPRLVGLGRWITDDVTVVYVNDVYVVKDHRRKGLTTWMLGCMNEQLALMPDIRGTHLIVQKGSSTETLYKQHFAMEDLAASDVLLVRKGPGEPAET